MSLYMEVLSHFEVIVHCAKKNEFLLKIKKLSLYEFQLYLLQFAINNFFFFSNC